MVSHKEAINSQANLNAYGEPVGNDTDRFAVRRRCNIPAMVVRADVGYRTPCRVLDISASGACLSIEVDQFGGCFSDRLNDEAFWLRLAHEGSQVRCRIAWREGNRYGVHFVSPMEKIVRQRKLRPTTTKRKKGFFGLIGT